MLDYDKCHSVSSDDLAALWRDVVEDRLSVDEFSPRRDDSIAREIQRKPDLVGIRRSIALGWPQPSENEAEWMSEFVAYWRNSPFVVDLDQRESLFAGENTNGCSRIFNVICESTEELSVALSTENEPLHIRLCQYLFWPWIREDEQQQPTHLQHTFEMPIGIDQNTRWKKFSEEETKQHEILVICTSITTMSSPRAMCFGLLFFGFHKRFVDCFLLVYRRTRFAFR